MANVNFGDYESRNWFERRLRDAGVYRQLEEKGIHMAIRSRATFFPHRFSVPSGFLFLNILSSSLTFSSCQQGKFMLYSA